MQKAEWGYLKMSQMPATMVIEATGAAGEGAQMTDGAVDSDSVDARLADWLAQECCCWKVGCGREIDGPCAVRDAFPAPQVVF